MAGKLSATLLGIEDVQIAGKDSTQIDFKCNKIGGKPNWASGSHLNPECRLCSRKMLLVGQIYAPLDHSMNHRTLYQFCCINQQCCGKSGSWICLRDEIEDSPSQSPLLPTPVAQPCDSFWTDDADDWSDSEPSEYKTTETNTPPAIEELSIEDSNISDPVKIEDHNITAYAEIEIGTGEESISVEPPLKPTEDIRNLLNPAIPLIPESAVTEFASFYLNVIEEQPWLNQKLDIRARELLIEYQSKENCDLRTLPKSATKNGSTDKAEDYEKSLPSHGDELVHKFITRLKSCPEQLIRYSRGDSPLLLQPLKESVPHCRHCGSKLMFEMQMMPHLSQRLKLVDSQHDGSLTEYGTVTIFTCTKSCWQRKDSPREEHVVIQSEMI